MYPMASQFDWLADWVESQVLATLVWAKRVDAVRMLTAFGLARFDLGERTLPEVIALGVPAVRIGTTADGWVYSVETLTTIGSDTAFLRRLTADHGEALSLCFTPTIETFFYAEDGDAINGFDITLPEFRFGSSPHAFDQQMEAAGLLAEEGLRRKAAVADFVERAFGLAITRGMLEDRLPCARLPG
jgi:hypothetical protein